MKLWWMKAKDVRLVSGWREDKLGKVGGAGSLSKEVARL